MKYYPKLNMGINDQEFSHKIFETLECVSKTYSQREAAKRLGISHSVLNRRIKESEEKFGYRLVETTGAGDAFNGGFAVALSEGMDLVEAARFGCAAAGISITRPGTAPSMPTRSEIDELSQ